MPSSTLTWLLEVPPPELPAPPVVVPSTQNYTSEEIAGAVDKLVQGAIRRPYGALGERQTNDTFSDTMDAAAGVFILTPSAPFYVLLLGSKRLLDASTSAATTAGQLGSAIVSTNRRVRPLTNITSLGNARTALAALESATAARDSVFEDIAAAPAFQRFDTHTDRFLADSAASIRVDENIVQTPQEARSQLANLVSTLTAAFQDIQRRVKLIAGGIENYNVLNLPALLAQGIISKAKEVLQDHIDELEPLSPTERLGKLRDTTLDVLAAKAVVKGFGSLPRSGTFVKVEGTGTVFADADHPGTAAKASSDFLDPYVIIEGADQLDFTPDGGVTVYSVPLSRSFVAKLDGTVAEPFVFDASNDNLVITVTGAGNLALTLSHISFTVEQMCTAINAAITTQPIVAEPYFNPEKFNGAANTTGASPTTVNFINPSGSFWSSLGITSSDHVVVSDPDSAMDGAIFSISFVSGTTISAVLISGPVPANETSIRILVGPASRFLRIRFTDAGAEDAVKFSKSIGTPEVTNQANITLGFFPGSLITSRRTRADEIALSINSNPASSSTTNVARVLAETAFVGTDPSNGRSDPNDPLKVISSIYRTFGDITVGGSSVTFAVSGALSAGVQVGNLVTLRTAAIAFEVNRYATITSVTDTEVHATTFPSMTAATGLDLEFGINIASARDTIVRILSPSVSEGDYRTVSQPSNVTELKLDRALPTFFTTGGQPLQFSMQVGALRVDFSSTSTGVDSEISIGGTAAGLFFNSPPEEAIGSTPFVLLQNDPKVLGVGDRFEIYTGQYNNPELSFAIIGFERGQKLLELDGQVPINFATLDFATDIAVPFARIRKVERNNYDAYKTQLDLWMQLDVNQPKYFSDLNRFLNPLIVNENPTASAVNTAKTHIESLIQALGQLQSIIASYQVDPVPRVDTLVTSLLERGSDRAVDTLLEGQFTTFFGYNSEEVSYIGDALERLRDVSRLDLPVRRKGRKEVVDQELVLGEFEEPDFEFDQSDTQDVNEPDIPGQFIDVPGSNF